MFEDHDGSAVSPDANPTLIADYIPHLLGKMALWCAISGRSDIWSVIQKDVSKVLSNGIQLAAGNDHRNALERLDAVDRGLTQRLFRMAATECLLVGFWQLKKLIDNEWTTDQYEKEGSALENLRHLAQDISNQFN